MTLYWYEITTVVSLALSSLALFYATRHCTSDLTIALVKEGSELSGLMSELRPAPEILKAKWQTELGRRGMAASGLATSKVQVADRLNDEAEELQRDLRSVLSARLKPETALSRLRYATVRRCWPRRSPPRRPQSRGSFEWSFCACCARITEPLPPCWPTGWR